jgi:peptidoglycan/xylan/chitin deacetylase (PgdA/CDA1 family)
MGSAIAERDLNIPAPLRSLIPSRFLVRHLPAVASAAVLLTFDDGPDPEVTPAVLDRLENYGARAVFFVVGRRIAQAPHVLREVLDRGHAIGNHSFQHYNGRQPSYKKYLADLRRCQDAIHEACGVEARLFRPPLGRITPTTILAPWMIGLRTVTWSVDVQDWRCREPEEAVELGLRLGRIARGADIVLLHDDNRCVLDLLDVYLPTMVQRQADLHSGLPALRAACGIESPTSTLAEPFRSN